MAGYDRPENPFIFKEPNQKRNTYNITFLPAMTGGNVFFLAESRSIRSFSSLCCRNAASRNLLSRLPPSAKKAMAHLPPTAARRGVARRKPGRALSEGERGYRPSPLPQKPFQSCAMGRLLFRRCKYRKGKIHFTGEKKLKSIDKAEHMSYSYYILIFA